MSTVEILLPTTIDTTIPMPAGARAVPYDPHAPLAESAKTADGLVLWGGAKDLPDRAARELPSLRWVQTLGAGYENVSAAGFDDSVTICNGASLHDATVAEHALMLSLAAARRVDVFLRDQSERRWSDRGGLQDLDNAREFTTLAGARVLIWGFGGIGQTLAPHLRMLGADVTGVARSTGERAGFPVVALDDVDRLLPETDLLVMVLPGSDENRHALDERRIRLLPSTAWLVNVGRGSTVDESALARALAAGRIGGAALDVFEVEPLPPESPLWDMNNVIISPHAAGGRPRGYSDLIAQNVEALLGRGQWRNVVRSGSGAEADG
ncbi:NAD(P)-dependent oxidoreductase [Phytoactinopolyspora halotolerans]|uniref:Phosphoglycerate dehydrogenase n=1 Tax=Phytoactinopolyspora halotolerans TaxID=1981512 RepID=A0A6L9S8G1_9ACTN|nr:NAD(P)-dependent oxidoreductase [Phytoactinopolyspora halotolerans]NEE00872.1 phosphoglycerate dehydrogenase [Phytoactinopolyspora halotolerans]